MMHHITEIRNQLYHHQWHIVEEVDGDDFRIAKYWIISHLFYPKQRLTLAFEAMTDLEEPCIEKSYSCFLLEDTSRSLYFSKNNKNEWYKNLAIFLAQIMEYAKNNALD